VRRGPRVLVLIIPTVILAAFVLASQGRSRSDEPPFNPTHPVWHWQGPFEFVREFGTNGPGCSYRGRQTVQATVICTGTDLRNLRCTATGAASYQYREDVGGRAARNDSGDYQGELRASYDTQVINGVDLVRLAVGANLPVEHRSASRDGVDWSNSILLDVSGSTRDLVFRPEGARLEHRSVQPIFEPGPSGCAVQGRFNGTETVSMRLLPTD